MLIFSLIVSLTLTLIIELANSVILGIRDTYNFKTIILANCITNPVVVYIANCMILLNKHSIYIISVTILEILAVVAEFLIFKKYLKFNKIPPLLISVINNVISFSFGLIITKFI